MTERKPMTTFNRATLAKVLEILDSSHAGEALAAAKLASTMVREAGLTWDDVLLHELDATTFGQQLDSLRAFHARAPGAFAYGQFYSAFALFVALAIDSPMLRAVLLGGPPILIVLFQSGVTVLTNRRLRAGMAPITLLERQRPSTMRRVGLTAMRAYLVVAVLLLVIRSIQLATGHS